MQEQCQCFDRGCPVHKNKGRCKENGTTRVARTDMEGVFCLFCPGCTEDALSSGSFAIAEPKEWVWTLTVSVLVTAKNREEAEGVLDQLTEQLRKWDAATVKVTDGELVSAPEGSEDEEEDLG